MYFYQRRLLVVLVAIAPLFLAAAPDLFGNFPKVQNILFIVSDDLKASVLGCYGNVQCETPNIDRLAQRGIVFERAYCQHTWCAPSRQSFMFGRYQGTGPVNLGQHLRKRGWYTARVGKIYHMRVPGDIIASNNGLDIASSWTERFNSQGQEAHTPGDYACLNLDVFTSELAGRQSTKLPHRMFVSVQCDGDGSDQPDHKTASKAIELLQEHSNEPFFLAVGFVRPHYPMVCPRQYFARYHWESLKLPERIEKDQADIPKPGLAKARSSTVGLDKYPDNQRRMWAAYYASVTFMDAQIGRILDELERLELVDSTAIVFTSDHGYHLGEHDFWLKSNLHEEVIRVPLIISVPGGKRGRAASIVELVDIYPTASDLSGIGIPSEVEGESLVPIIEECNTSVKSSAICFGPGKSVALRTCRWAYMRYENGSEELYDMKVDPRQFHNLANNSDYDQTLRRQRELLSSRLRVSNSADDY